MRSALVQIQTRKMMQQISFSAVTIRKFHKGTDGEMSILYNGVQTTITSSSNTFSIDGLDIKATNTFNTGSATAEGGVSFTASADTEKVTETVKKFY